MTRGMLTQFKNRSYLEGMEGVCFLWVNFIMFRMKTEYV